MKNLTKKTKTILFASLIAAMILPFSTMDFAEAKKGDFKFDKDDLKNDVKKWMKDDKDKSRSDKVGELKSKYNELLRESIEEVRLDTNTRVLTENEIKQSMHYIVTEAIKDEKEKDRISKYEQANDETLSTDYLESLGIQYVDATCPSTTNPTYKQVSIDIDGGSYGGNTGSGGF